MPRICIDARFWGVKHTGIGRYVENLIDNLPSDPDIEVVLIVHPDQLAEPRLARFKKFTASAHPYSSWAQLEMVWLLWRVRPDLLHVPHFTLPILWLGKTVVTIHDLIKHLSRGPQASTHTPVVYWLKYAGYLLTVWLAVHRASHIIVPAKYWKDFLVDKYRVDPSKILVTYEGVSEAFLKGRSFKDNPFRIVPPFVVYTGNLYPHKNVPILIKAVEKLKVNLAVVCARDVFAGRLPQSKYVHFLGRLTDEQLVSLYRQATAFVFPSLIEGFGLPGLEAMAAGLPVIAARASCLPEIYADAALYFDPFDAADLAGKIKAVLTDSKLRQDLVERGKKMAHRYSWSKMAAQTWQVYRNVLR